MKLTLNQMFVLHEWNEKRGRNEMVDESQNRIDSIIKLMMEEAKTLEAFHPRERIWYVMSKVRERVMKIMRTMRE